jgi:CRISPR-associated protein Cmr5
MQNTCKTVAQERSAFALECLEKLNCDRDKFAKLVAGLPAMMLQNGFGQAMAFMLAKATESKSLKFKPNDRHKAAFDIIKEWLVKQQLFSAGNETSFMKQLSLVSQSHYLQAQHEAMALLEWVKRYANAGLFK